MTRVPFLGDYQRLVANPLLGVMFWIVAFVLTRESVRRHGLALLGWALVCVLIGIVFLQFHCLDCGKTGWLFRSRVHACPAVVARQQAQWQGRVQWPGLRVQLAVWFIVLMAASVLGMVVIGSWR